MSDVTNLTTSFKEPILSIALVEIQVAPAHAEYPCRGKSKDQKSHSEGHTPEGGTTTSEVGQPISGCPVQEAQSAPCIPNAQTGNMYPPQLDPNARKTPPPARMTTSSRSPTHHYYYYYHYDHMREGPPLPNQYLKDKMQSWETPSVFTIFTLAPVRQPPWHIQNHQLFTQSPQNHRSLHPPHLKNQSSSQ